MLLVLDFLFRQGKEIYLFHHFYRVLMIVMNVMIGYRRITAEVDSRNIIGRKFLERCGFYLETILCKHRVVHHRNCDSALYVMLNSDWADAERALKALLHLSVEAVAVKAAEIEQLSIGSEGMPLGHKDKYV